MTLPMEPTGSELGSPVVEEAIRALLVDAGVSFEVLEHPPIEDAVHAAALRRTPLAIGGKTLLMKADCAFVLVATSAAGRLDSRRLRRHLGVRRLRFATRDELLAQTGLVPGCVPPLGAPVFPLPLHADHALVVNGRIAFTPGLRTRTFVMASADWLRVASPLLGDFAGELA